MIQHWLQKKSIQLISLLQRSNSKTVIKTKNGRTVLSSKCAMCSKSQDLRKNKKQKEC